MSEGEFDRRIESRQNLNLLVGYPDLQGYKIDVTESVSPCGVFVRSSQHHRLGEKVQLAISLPGFPQSIRITGEVSRIREATPQTPRGVAFYIDQEEFLASIDSLMSPTKTYKFSLSSGPYSVLAALPRIHLACTPTPLHRAERLSKALGGPDIWFKREDLTGFALGGSKVRKLEFIVGHALEMKANVLVTGATEQRSGRIRVLSAIAARLGLRVVALVAHPIANQEASLSEMCGCEFRPFIDPTLSVDENIELCTQSLLQEGDRPYTVNESEVNWRGAASYMLASIELLSQLRQVDLRPEVLVTPVGSAETMAGLVTTQRWLDLSYDVLGFSVKNDEYWCGQKVAMLSSELCTTIHLADTIPVDDIWVNADFVGSGYGIATPASIEATRLVAQHEGIFLDPVFSGKAMAGLIDFIARGELSKGQSIVFLQTGAPVDFL